MALLQPQTGETEGRLTTATVLLRKVHAELVQDISCAAKPRAESACTGRDTAGHGEGHRAKHIPTTMSTEKISHTKAPPSQPTDLANHPEADLLVAAASACNCQAISAKHTERRSGQCSHLPWRVPYSVPFPSMTMKPNLSSS